MTSDLQGDPRAVRPQDFPEGGTDAEQLCFLLRYAVLAPSSHNSQPWLFEVHDDVLHVLADRTRGLPVVDPADRELTISCGAAIGNLEVATRRFGLQGQVSMRTPDDEPDLLARVRLATGRPPSERERVLFDAIPERCTDRSAFSDAPIPAAVAAAMQRLAEDQGVELLLTREDDHKVLIADLVEQGDRTQFEDKRFRRELASWVHSRRLGGRDGMSAAGFGMPDVLAPVARLVLRTFDLGDGIAAADARKISEGSPALVLLATTADEVSGWLDAGRALARCLLLLRAEGLSVSYLNQPIEVDTLRPLLRKVFQAAGYPQLLLRVGWGRGCAPTVRRPVAEVLVHRRPGGSPGPHAD